MRITTDLEQLCKSVFWQEPKTTPLLDELEKGPWPSFVIESPGPCTYCNAGSESRELCRLNCYDQRGDK